MCTAVSFLTKEHYFGRNLDLEYSYIETVAITPRNFPFHFRKKETLKSVYNLLKWTDTFQNQSMVEIRKILTKYQSKTVWLKSKRDVENILKG